MNLLPAAWIASLTVLSPAIAAVCAGTMLALGIVVVLPVFARVVRGRRSVRRFLPQTARTA